MKRKRIMIVCSLLCCAAFVLSIAFSAMSSVVLAGDNDSNYGNVVDNDNYQGDSGQYGNVTNVGTTGQGAQAFNASGDPGGMVFAPQNDALGSPTTAGPQYRQGTVLMDNQITAFLTGSGTLLSGDLYRVTLNITTSSIDNDVYFKDVRVLVKIPDKATGVASSPYGVPDDAAIEPWLYDEPNRPKVTSEIISDGSAPDGNYAVLYFPVIYNWHPTTGSTDSREFFFNYIPFPNGTTPDGAEAVLTTLIQYKDENGQWINAPVSDQNKNTITQKARAAFDWQDMNKTANSSANWQQIPHDATGSYDVNPDITFTVSTKALYNTILTSASSSKGAIWAQGVTLTDTMTLPEGVSVAASDIDAGDGVVSVNGNVVTVTWTIPNPTSVGGGLPTANIADISRTLTIKTVTIDGAVFTKTQSKIIENKVVGSAAACVGGATDALAQKLVNVTLKKLDEPAPEKESFAVSNEIKKGLTGTGGTPQNPRKYGAESTFRIFGFGNFQPTPSTSELTSFVVEDTWTGDAGFQSLSTGVYEGAPSGTYTVKYRTNTNASWQTFTGGDAVSFTSSKTLTVPGLAAGTYVTGVRFEFGTVSPGFKVSGGPDSISHANIGNAPSITIKPAPEGSLKGKTYSNTAKVSFNHVLDNLNQTSKSKEAPASVTYEHDGLPTIGSFKYAENLTASDRTEYYPGDTVKYTLAIVNTHATASWMNPLIIDYMSRYVDPSAASFKYLDAQIYGFDGPYDENDPPIVGNSDGTYTLVNGKNPTPLGTLPFVTGVTGPDVSQTLANDPKGNSAYKAVFSYDGEIKPNQLLLITYQVNIKDFAALSAMTGTDLTKPLSVLNWFRAFHRPEDNPGPGPGGGDIDLGSDGNRTINVGSVLPTFDVRKQISIDDGVSYADYKSIDLASRTVKYKLIVKNVRDAKTYDDAKYKANLILADVLPPGFSFVAGSTQLVRTHSGTPGAPTTPAPDIKLPTPTQTTYGTLLSWDLGTSERGDVYELTFTAQLDETALKASIGTVAEKNFDNFVGLYVYNPVTGATDRTKPINNYLYSLPGVTNQYYAMTQKNNNAAEHNVTFWDGTAVTTTKRLQSYARLNVKSPEKYLSITKALRSAANPANAISGNTVNIGDEVAYLITIKNTGKTTNLSQKYLVDILPKGMEFVPGSMVYRYNAAISGTTWLTSASNTPIAPVVSDAGDGMTKLAVTHDTPITIVPGQYLVYAFKAKATDAAIDGDALNQTRTNYAACFQETADNVGILSADSTITKKVVDSDAQPLFDNWNTSSTTDDRFYASVNLEVKRKYPKPGIFKRAYTIDSDKMGDAGQNYGWQVYDKTKDLVPGTVMGWELIIANDPAATAPIVDPYLIDVLPVGLSFDNAFPVRIQTHKYNASGTVISSTALATYDDPTLLSNPTSVQGTRLGWDLSGKTLEPGDAIVIRFHATISTSFEGETVNGAYITTKEKVFDVNATKPTGAGVDNWGSVRRAETDAQWTQGGQLDAVYNSAEIAVYSELGTIGQKVLNVYSPDGQLVGGPAKNLTAISATKGDTATYDLIVKNVKGQKELSSLVLIDRLPEVNDYGLHTFTMARKSEWNLPLPAGFDRSSIEVYKGNGDNVDPSAGALISGGTLYFTKITGSQELDRQTVWNADEDPGAAWHTDYRPGDNMFRIAFPESTNVKLATSKDWLMVRFSTIIPADGTANGYAWNSFAFNLKSRNAYEPEADSQLMFPNEPLKVGILTDNLDFKKWTVGGVKDGGADNVVVPFDSNVTFKLDDIRNPSLTKEATKFTLLDEPNYGRGGLDLVEIRMPRFENAGGVQYTVSVATNLRQSTAFAPVTRSASGEETITAQDLGVDALPDTEWITKIFVDFGTVPAQFKNAKPIEMQFTAVNKPDGVYASHVQGGVTIPENTGNNTATFEVGDRKLVDWDWYEVFDLSVSIAKHTMLTTSGVPNGLAEAKNSAAVDPAYNVPLTVTTRRMFKDASGVFHTAFSLYGSVKNTAPGLATLTLTDLPELLTGGGAQAGLVPYEIGFPVFSNDGGSSYTVQAHFAGDAAATWTSVGTYSAANAQTATISNPTDRLIDEIKVTFTNVPSGFEQAGGITVKAKYVGNLNLMPGIASAPGWSQAWNGVKLAVTYNGVTKEAPLDRDYASIFLAEDAEEFLQITKTAVQPNRYEKDETAQFTITNVANQLKGARAKGFRFFDIPQANSFKFNALTMPAFMMDTAEAVGYKVYATTAATIGVTNLPLGSYDPQVGPDITAQRAAVDAWLDSNIWTEVYAHTDSSVASSKITLPADATAFKVEFEGAAADKSVPVNFRQGGDILVEVDVGSVFTGWTQVAGSASGSTLYQADNYVALCYDGNNALGAYSMDSIFADVFTFDPKVTKDTDLTVNPNRETLLGGLARFQIGSGTYPTDSLVRNYVEGRAAELMIVDRPDASLTLYRLSVPAYLNSSNSLIDANAPAGDNVKYTVSVRSSASGAWTPVADTAGNISADASKAHDFLFDTSKRAYEFKIEFGDYQINRTDAGGNPIIETVVPAAFRPMNDLPIAADFIVSADESYLGKRLPNEVTLTNTYRGEAKSASDDDYVIPDKPDDEIKKTSSQPVVPVGNTAMFTIEGIRNYLNIEATKFRFVDTPEKGLYLTELRMPIFRVMTAPNSTFKTTYTVSADTADGKTIRLTDASGNSTFDSDKANVIVTPAANRALGTYVTQFTVAFAGEGQYGTVPAGFGQSAAITTVFLTDPSLAVHAPDYSLINKVELLFNNEHKQSQDKVDVFDPDVRIDINKEVTTPQVRAGDDAIFTIDGVENKLIVEADKFELRDTPHEALYLKSIMMPTFTNPGNVTYDIYARINDINAAPTLIKQDLEASKAYNVVLSNLGENDRVAEIIMEFGTVPAGFVNSTPITMTFRTSENRAIYLPGDLADNHVGLSYTKYGYNLSARDSAITRVIFDTRRILKVPGNTTVVRGQEVGYTVSGFENLNGTTINNYAIDDIPQNGISFRRVELPAFTLGEGVRYGVAFRTNLNSTFRLMGDDLDASVARTVYAPQLSSGEYFTTVRVIFESVPNGFGVGDSINFVFEVTADPSLLGTETIINQVRYSYTTSGDTPPYTPVTYNNYNTYNSYNTTTNPTTVTQTPNAPVTPEVEEEVPYSFINIPEEEVPYAPIKVKNPMAVTGEDGMAPMYWIIVAIALVIGAGMVALSSTFKSPSARKRRR